MPSCLHINELAGVEHGCVPRETRERLARFVGLALEWNRTIRLVAAGDAGVLWHRHVADSLQLADQIPSQARTGIDIGSGGGFPGMVLAISTPVKFTLTEPDRRKAAFLQEAARVTGTDVRVFPDRIEVLEARADVVTARAVAELDVLMRLASTHLAVNGVCLFLKGAGAAAEIERARDHWSADIVTIPSRTDSSGSIVWVENLRPR
jgi:16S rRNA (guanine527-N7)-methyltransferase